MSALSHPRRRPRQRVLIPLPGVAKAPPRPLRVGLLGGSFNPAHEGHLYISVEALRRLRLDQVWWLVSPQNPLKPVRDMAPFETRMAWARAVARRHPRIEVRDLEARFGTRYTVDTLERLLRWRGYRFVWIVGADNLAQLPQWRQWWRLFSLVPIAVFERSPYSYSALAGKAARRFAGARLPEREARRLVELGGPAWVFIRLRPHPASATAIRRRWRREAGRDHGE